MQADEICFPLSFKDGADPEVKPPRLKGPKKGGLFGEQICMPCAPDPDRRVVARVAKLGNNSAAGPAGGFWRQDRRRPRKRFRRRSLLQKVLRTKRIQAGRIAWGKEQKRVRHPSHQQPPSGLRQCINGGFHGAATKCFPTALLGATQSGSTCARARKSKGFALRRSFAIKPLQRSLAKRSAVANAFQPFVDFFDINTSRMLSPLFLSGTTSVGAFFQKCVDKIERRSKMASSFRRERFRLMKPKKQFRLRA